ncbi:DJ-1/PfpI family protein [Vibrio hepatarius]|uniref:DJ-1/PfpI family protein n=1 Tax=Vibrio hepatarius TaxID=171383 RepID=UPI001C0A266F|nr:DJ-1/PfpI family protein [Vibrio hepatarius]MBU2895548.1 DJ-1/PfpI family protein [Vibrio hepatarius]
MDCPRVDILLVPSSGNPIEQINDTQVIQYLKVVGKREKYITSVCTGSLILAETGLLDGYKTATHWAYQEVLSFYPQVTYVDKRVVVDRNRISGGGVTAGIDFALTLVAELSNRERAQHIELLFEYDPKPPFQTGNPHTDPRQLKKNVQANVRKLAPELFRDRSKG